MSKKKYEVNVIAVEFTHRRKDGAIMLDMTVLIADHLRCAHLYRKENLIEYPYHIISRDTFQTDPAHTDDTFWLGMIITAFVQRKIGMRVLKRIARILSLFAELDVPFDAKDVTT